uniref:Uncharacterized protein n=1 Tax=Cyphia schlechteri TaxID=2041121 RepID=A0A291F507_9ASTR|nr:hypothetical protein Cyp_sch1Pt0762 [Cyphia schlechteri]ATG27217.1 hypothetical protein Cyp_sch1Pt0762 [Cyphia schlechteri]
MQNSSTKLRLNKILLKIDAKLVEKTKELDTFNHDHPADVEYYLILVNQLYNNPRKLGPEEDNRLFFFVFHVSYMSMSKKSD